MWFRFLLTTTLLVYLTSGEEFILGYLTGSQRKPGDLEYPRPGLTISGAISYAVDEVNHLFVLKNLSHKLSFTVAETFGDEEISIREVSNLWKDNVHGYIGPQETCIYEGRMAASFDLPMISYFCTHPETSDKKKFRTFARTRPPDTQISKSVASVLLAFEWTKVVFFYLDSEDDEFKKVAETIIKTLNMAGITVLFTKTWYSPYHHGYSSNPFHELVKNTYMDARIYVILGHHYEHIGLLVAMEEQNLLSSGDYFVVGVDIEQYDSHNPGKYLKGLLRDDSDDVTKSAFRSYLGVVPSPTLSFDNFSAKVNQYMEQPPFNFTNPLNHLGLGKVIRAEAAYLYDAVHLYARGLLSLLERGLEPRNGTALVDSIRGTRYKSAMGYMVYLDENGDAEGNYTLLVRRPHHVEADEYGLYPVGVFTRKDHDEYLPELTLLDYIDWVNGAPPIAEPPCGFRGEKCITHTGQIAEALVGAILLVVTITSLVFYRNWRYEQELDSLLWKVDFKDIQMNEEDMSQSLGTKITRATHPLIRTSQVSLSSNPDADFRYSAIYTTIGIYKGRVFGIKKVKKKSIDITRNMKKELKMMKDLRHDNLNSFIGACTDAPNICIVTEYCTRGSLRDILENEDVKLDNMFVASLVGDIIRGMIYLHDSPVRIHGRLKTSNCLVDSRWVLKISDFGFHEFKKGAEESSEDVNYSIRKTESLLYVAPELLRAEGGEPLTEVGTQKGDVYSFSIILYQLHGRRGPYGDCGLSHTEILKKVLESTCPGFRPQLELLENSFDFVRDCLKECWAENPDDRPDFKMIRTKLRPMRKGMKPNIFDNMMAMMEKYANNLEALVDDRTDQLVEEKKKTEALLYEMLPRSVAEQLKRGNKVEAENYDCVTIYFSDIVGFTAMSAESTPLQVVDFLNDLYTCFDSIIEHYDVYKVETIGDAYMCVSGLPIRNGDQHAAEIASMSLHLLEAVKEFTIGHRPKDNLQLRIGIHSGPVCAGVVGLKMPRYCLFGDTVNTASRMESTGDPDRIHCSSETQKLLDRLEGYKLKERGFVVMKGKGDKLTYWLTGEDEDKKIKRSKERETRRGSKNKQQIQTNKFINCPPGPRSSMKQKHSNCSAKRSPLARCSSLESPKKLRFASVDVLEQKISLEVISDSSPKGGLLEVHHEGRRTSSSCPCIENFESCVVIDDLVTRFAHQQFNNTSSVPALSNNNSPKKINIYIDPDEDVPLLEQANNIPVIFGNNDNNNMSHNGKNNCVSRPLLEVHHTIV